MSLFALPLYLYPILMLVALALPPLIQALRLGFDCVRAFFAGDLVHLPVAVRARAVLCVFLMCSQLDIRAYLRKVKRGLMVAASTVAFGLAAVLLAAPIAALVYLGEMAEKAAEAVAPYTQPLCKPLLDACQPLNRALS